MCTRGTLNDPSIEPSQPLFPQGYHNKRLRQNMRNGLLHFYAPHPGLPLGRLSDPGVSKRITEANHPYSDASGYVTLVIEFFFNDFRVAGDRVIGMRFPRSDKMSRRFIRTDLPVRH
jgi:hypothetical protein